MLLISLNQRREFPYILARLESELSGDATIQRGTVPSRDVKFARKFFLAYLTTYLENYKSDLNLKCIKIPYNYFIIKYIIR